MAMVVWKSSSPSLPSTFLITHSSFYINLPIGGFAAGIILLIFTTPKASYSDEARNTPLKEKFLQMDLIGTGLIFAAVICLLLALGWGGVQKTWKSSDVIGTLIGFGLITIAFGLVERWQGPRALLLGRIIRRREVWSGCIFCFLSVWPIVPETY